MDESRDRDRLPSSLRDYAFGSGTRAGIAVFGNDAGGLATLERPLRYAEAHETLEACLNEELNTPSPQPRKTRKLAISNLWSELDDPATLREILLHHRHMYYAWRCGDGIDPVGMCVIDGMTHRLDELLAAGHSVNAAEGELSPLHLAVDDENEPMTAALLERGANVNASDERGRSALSCAAGHGAAALVSSLLAAGANPLQTDKDGKTALIFAARRGHRACAHLLMPVSNCNHRDANGQTAEDCAAQQWPDLASEISAYLRAADERSAIAENLVKPTSNTHFPKSL
jgi:hypothetical protein